MTTRSRLALLLVAAAAILWLLPRDRFPAGAVLHAAAYDPYQTEILMPYAELRAAIQSGDVASLRTIATGDDYRAYRAARAIAQDFTVPPDVRLEGFERVLALRIDDPLAYEETRALHLEIGRIAEAANRPARALAAYREALPHPDAAAGVRRVEDDPYQLANAFLQARMYRDALDELGDLTAPSIEAPSYRALDDHARALDAYQRWLEQQPSSSEAAFGIAWSHFYLADMDAAGRAFAALDGPTALYGQALVARRDGDTDLAVRLMRATGTASRMWLATGWLEQQDRYADAVDVYLEIARTEPDSSYADDAAYRALVLAERLGDSETMLAAGELIPPDSFFALVLGASIPIPTVSQVDDVVPQAIPLARALVGVHDVDAAVGELSFALRAATSLDEGVALAEMLQTMGEYRQSQRYAASLVARGSDDLRVWRLAWPEAFAPVVRAEGEAHDVPPELVWAVMRQESAFYSRARSRSNAMGLMQVIPSTWTWLAELQKEEPGDPFDPATNIRYGAFYLRYLLDYFDGDMELAVSSYNRGQGYIRRLFEGEVVDGDMNELYREIDALETREYLQRVIVNYEVYQAIR